MASNDLDELEKLALVKIKLWAENGKLISHPELEEILFHWRAWGTHIEVSDHVEKSIQKDSDLLQFISAFMQKSSKRYVINYVGTSQRQIDLNGIEILIDTNIIEPRIRKIREASGFTDLPEMHQSSVKSFLDAFDGNVEDDDL